jgi:hypothetical protein
MSVASTVIRGRSFASETAMQPLPVPASAAQNLASRSGKSCRTGDQNGRRDEKAEAPELLLAGDIGERLARLAPRDQGAEAVAEVGGRLFHLAGQQAGSVPPEHVAGEQPRIERRFVAVDASRLETPTGVGDELRKGHELSAPSGQPFTKQPWRPSASRTGSA